MVGALAWALESCGQLIDPHTAIGLHAARAATIDPAIPVVTLATAHPGKFRDVVERATGTRPSLPTRVGDLFRREEKFTTLDHDYDALAAFIEAHATPSA